eukprot:2909011-Pleurochrysis_carterae.AAC.2
MHCWFMLALPSWRLAHAALATLELRWTLPFLAAGVHAGCWGNNCRWPFVRHPHELEESILSRAYFGHSPTLQAALRVALARRARFRCRQRRAHASCPLECAHACTRCDAFLGLPFRRWSLNQPGCALTIGCLY